MIALTNLQIESALPTWFPKIKDILPVPKTIILNLTPEESIEAMNLLDGVMISDALYSQIKESAARIGYPLFLRTDQGSAKHDWKDTCYVESEDKLVGHVAALVNWQLMRFLPAPRALVFRELLPLYSRFKAFDGELPISRERRFFVEDGKVQCRHPYWPEGAIEKPDYPDWKEHLSRLNEEMPNEVGYLTALAEVFSRLVPGFWSVDFAQDKSGQWYMIDAARGELSYHLGHGEDNTE